MGRSTIQAVIASVEAPTSITVWQGHDADASNVVTPGEVEVAGLEPVFPIPRVLAGRSWHEQDAGRNGFLSGPDINAS
jgi:hypothetical protein